MRANLDPFQAIADPSRRGILMLLTKNKLSINSLAGNFDISRPAVSKHVKVLYDAGLIQIKDQGRERYCELKPDGFDEVKEWLNFFDKFWKNKLQNLENLLNER
ncbi:helix-turn-helix transcriptional regulator [Mucilaginibacter sp.]|uniref:ArsR/SmtB family transcription factor n=1 Tax=Mucilaginibacter sp. TaxID=1882438 RepID=UPI00262096A9|nr:metalloregulator ArsR/SmtB family transcription factor [Mucilaginibacter sp.]MDB4921436.1 HTH-type transcriptional regulator [Mucilaginibacter sp.]